MKISMLFACILIIFSSCSENPVNNSSKIVHNENSTIRNRSEKVWSVFWENLSSKMQLKVSPKKSLLLNIIKPEHQHFFLDAKSTGMTVVMADLSTAPNSSLKASLLLDVSDGNIYGISVSLLGHPKSIKKALEHAKNVMSSTLGTPIPKLIKEQKEGIYVPVLTWRNNSTDFWFLIPEINPTLKNRIVIWYKSNEVDFGGSPVLKNTDALPVDKCLELFDDCGWDISGIIQRSDNQSELTATNEELSETSKDKQVANLMSLLNCISIGSDIRELAKIRPSIHENELGARKSPEKALEGKYIFSEGAQDTLVPNTHHLIYYDSIDGIVSDTTLFLTGEPGLIDFFREHVLKSLEKDWGLESCVISNLEKNETVLNFPVLLLRLKDEGNVVSLGIQFQKHVKEQLETIIIILRKGPLEQVTEFFKTPEQTDNELFEKTYRENGLDYNNLQSLFPS
ncbi:MAG: hypothetical protein KAH38_08050 [Candidatus Hydrogenedentes bacterium]|nr:hypothetical protein [Candidatus Hydrogenedentota bacterium]